MARTGTHPTNKFPPHLSHGTSEFHLPGKHRHHGEKVYSIPLLADKHQESGYGWVGKLIFLDIS